MILHLSDLHFGTEKKECLDAIRRFVTEHEIEAVVVSGDLTQRARFKQFYACKIFLDSLGLPYIVIPGNHDIPLFHLWRRFFNPFGRYQMFFGMTEQVLETENFYIMGLNTIHPKFHTKGTIHLDQIAAVAEKLKQSPSRKRTILLTHQPFYVDSLDRSYFKDRPENSILALKVWAPLGLDAILHGHLHQSAVYDLNKVYALNAHKPLYEVHAGTATSYRLHHQTRNSFNLIDASLKVVEYYFEQQQSKFIIFNESQKI